MSAPTPKAIGTGAKKLVIGGPTLLADEAFFGGKLDKSVKGAVLPKSSAVTPGVAKDPKAGAKDADFAGQPGQAPEGTSDKRTALASVRRPTVLTGPLGTTGQARVRRKTLLGE